MLGNPCDKHVNIMKKIDAGNINAIKPLTKIKTIETFKRNLQHLNAFKDY